MLIPTERLLNRRLPLHSGQSLHPATTSHPAGPHITRHQRGFKQFTRPVFPSPVAPGWNRSPWAFPRASNPAGSAPTTHVEVGTGHRARTWNNAHDISRTSNHACPLIACDLASQEREKASADTATGVAGLKGRERERAKAETEGTEYRRGARWRTGPY